MICFLTILKKSKKIAFIKIIDSNIKNNYLKIKIINLNINVI